MILLNSRQYSITWVHLGRKLVKIVSAFAIAMNQSLKEEIQILRLMLYREDALPSDPACCIHCGPLLRKIALLEQQLAETHDKSVA